MLAHQSPLRPIPVLTLLAALGCLQGCANSDVSPVSFTMRHITQGDVASVLMAARTVLTDEHYTISRTVAARGTINAYYLGADTRASGVRSGTALSAHTRTRRAAEVRCVPRESGLTVYCKVSVQEQVTEAYRLLWLDTTSSDLPSATPIERGAAATTEQNTVWRTLRRDKLAERRIIEAVMAMASVNTIPVD